MIESSDLRLTRMPLNNGSGQMPALGFGTLIPDAGVTKTATRDALEAGFRHFDCAERYRNEREVGEALRAGRAAGRLGARRDFRDNKVVELQSSARARRTGVRGEPGQTRARVSGSLLIHTPFAFQPGDEQDPRDQNGKVLYDNGVTLLDTWRAMES